jgi:hypothetical protein
MGTNYFNHHNRCDTCGRAEVVEHIGKSSIGWRFLFHTEEGLPRSWAEWRERLAKGHIVDEYDQPVTLEEFEALVERKKEGRMAEFDLDPRSSRSAFLDDEGHPFAEYEFS